MTAKKPLKHVDIRCKYVNKDIKDGIVQIACKKSVDHDSNVLTKNLGGELHQTHSNKMLTKIGEPLKPKGRL